MKKLIYVLTLAMVLISAAAIAETAYVTISDSTGSIVLAREAVELTDTDGDGVLSISDALYLAHENHFEGGAEGNYLAEDLGYGLSLSKLWGEDNGGSYGYYVNNGSAISLLDALSDGDYVQAYAFTDLTAWSDTYCYFQSNSAEMNAGDAMSFTLTALTYDANWNLVATPVEGAVITVNGTDSCFVTDAEGTVSISIDEAGEHIISARSETMTLVPPVCMLSVS